MQHRATIMLAAVVMAVLAGGCLPITETGGFYTRSWYDQHLVMFDRNPERTHFVAVETYPPGFHYAAEATLEPATRLIVHVGGESIDAFDITRATLDHWQRLYFDAQSSVHTPASDGVSMSILRHRGGEDLDRFLECTFRASDGKLTSFSYRVGAGSVDELSEGGRGPFQLSLGDGPRFQLPVTISAGEKIVVSE